jgi:electron transfer flavoprotein beta subunit
MVCNCVVLIKQVPDTKNVTTVAMKDDGTVNRAALPAIFNPDDLHALELALAIKEATGGKVTVITMGPPSACEALREALYRGADEVFLITDRRCAASDTLATSYILSCAVRKVGDYNLVLCGRQASRTASPSSVILLASSTESSSLSVVLPGRRGSW